MDRVDIERIVEEVVRKIGERGASAGAGAKVSVSTAYSTLDDLIERSREAQRRYQELGFEVRRRVISAIRKVALEHADELGRLAVDETGLGKMPDKREKVVLAATKTPGVEDLVPRTYTGDHGLTLEELAPYGVVVSITPSTNPPSTIVNNAISILAGGNSVIFQPHPGAKRVSVRTAELVREAVASAGAPADVVLCVSEPTIEGAQYLMKHDGVDLLLVTGGEGVVRAAMNSGKKAICAGPGNPPVVVDETADIGRAARDIVSGASFDNGVLCTAEKEVFVVESVADALMREMRAAGAIQLSSSDAARVTELVIAEDPAGHGERKPVINKKFVGKNASVIARACGIDVPDGAPILFFEAEWDHPLVMAEQLMPVLPVVRVPTVDEAMRLAVLVEHGFRHTFIMHSKNIERLSRMAKLCNANIFVKNGPSYAGLGYMGEGYTTLSIAGTTGEGLTSAKDFVRPRRCVLVDYFKIV